MRQRGYRLADVQVVERLGTPSRDGLVLLEKDIKPELERLAKERKLIRNERVAAQNLSSGQGADKERNIARQIQQLRRLAGTFIPVKNGHALSIYRPSARRLKYQLRGRRRTRHKHLRR